MTMQRIEPELKKRVSPAGGNLSLPVIVSIGLHLLLVGGLVYASTQIEPPKRVDVDEGMSVMMLDISGSSEPLAESAVEAVKTEESIAESQPEIVPEPEVVSEPEPEVPEPEVIPEPIQEPKIVIPEKKVEPKPKPKKPVQPAKPKTQPVSKPAAKSATTVSSNTGASSTTAATGSSVSAGGKPVSRPKPAYPERARAMGVEGKVKVKFDIDAAGKVQNIQIVSETPKNMFARDVRRAMLRWRYEANKPTKNLSTTFVFNLNGKVDMA